MTELDDLEKLLLSEATKAASVQDMSTIATALKTTAEARTALSSELTGKRAYLLELIKSLSAFLVPIVSLIALAATVIVQTKQIEATRQQVEDSEWRDLLGSLKGSSDSIYTDLTIAPRLTSFAASATYGAQAKAISIRLMGRLSNPDGFQDLFSYVFPAITSKDIPALLEVARSLTKSKRALENHCDLEVAISTEANNNIMLSDCAEFLNDLQFAKLEVRNKMAKQLETSRRSLIDINTESYVLAQHLYPLLRQAYGDASQNKDHEILDLSNIYIPRTDLSDMDMSSWNIRNTIFDDVNMANADLSTSMFEESEFRGCNWWDARAITPDLLDYLLKWWYPFALGPTRYPVKVNEQQYRQRVKRLCAVNQMTCPTEIKFGAQQPS